MESRADTGQDWRERQAILPVLDLKRGQVVHGVAGQRSTYRPIVSQVVNSSEPVDVARALCELVGVDDLYVADLDSLAGHDVDVDTLRDLFSLGLRIWLDAGVDGQRKVRQLGALGVARWIVALESLKSFDALEALVQSVPRDQLVFSLDLHEGRPVAADRTLRHLPAEVIAAQAVELGVASMIVLDTSAVGVPGRLATIELCRQLSARFQDLELVSGGGVRDRQDVCRFVDAGCHRVLVASALHRRAIRF